jgi:hypothetical protein
MRRTAVSASLMVESPAPSTGTSGQDCVGDLENQVVLLLVRLLALGRGSRIEWGAPNRGRYSADRGGPTTPGYSTAEPHGRV